MTSPWSPTPRQRLTDQQRAELFVDENGKCFDCGRFIRSGEVWTVEHVIALENGGTNDRSNLKICCPNCKPTKDASDHHKAAKSRHVRTKHVLPRSQRTSRFPGWRKFDGTPVWNRRGG